MVLRRVVLALFIFVPLTACTLDSRKQAVDEVVQFGLDSPFEILTVNDGESYLAVADSALADYNRIFDYLPKSNDVDSARYYYNRWMRLILAEASFSSVEGLVYSLEADTLVAEIAVRRPELSEFNRVIVSQLGNIDTAVLNDRLTRAKRELQIRDTLVLRVVAGPRIVTWSSAVSRRDSMVTAAGALPLTEAQTEVMRVAPTPVVRPQTAVAVEEEPLIPDPADSTLHFWIAQNANIRVGPGMNFAVSATQPVGAEVTADSLFEGWYHVRDARGKVDGFIASSLVSLTPVSPVVQSETPKAASAPRRSEASDSAATKPDRESSR